jgi:hypothetical protein
MQLWSNLKTENCLLQSSERNAFKFGSRDARRWVSASLFYDPIVTIIVVNLLMQTS